jgi:hypothetical protein
MSGGTPENQHLAFALPRRPIQKAKRAARFEAGRPFCIFVK